MGAVYEDVSSDPNTQYQSTTPYGDDPTYTHDSASEYTELNEGTAQWRLKLVWLSFDELYTLLLTCFH